MYSTSTIQECLKGLVGFKQPKDPDYPQLMPWLLTSESGNYFDEYHPLIKIENIVLSAPKFDAYVYVAWSALTTYTKGQVVKNGSNVLFESLDNGNLNHALPTSGSNAYWRETNGISIYLQDIKLAAIDKVISDVVEKKKLDRNTKTLLSDLKLFEGAGSYTDKIIGMGRFVGFEINLKKEKDITISIKKLGTQFDEANGEFKLYLFHSSQVEAIEIFTLDLQKQVSFEWTALTDCILQYNNDNISPGGTFYLGYFEDDLEGQAIERKDDLSKPCSSCNWVNNQAWENWSKYIQIDPFSVAAADLNGVDLWDIKRIQYRNSTNWGLNFSITVECDISDFVCRNSDVLKDVIGKQVAHDLIREMGYNIRNNGNAERLKQMALFELDNREKTPGLVAQLGKAKDAVEFDFSDINAICLPCNNKRGIKVKSF